VDVIASNHVVQDGQTEALLNLEEPVQITPPIARELQEKLSLMAAVHDVPDNPAESSGSLAASFFLGGRFSASKLAF
jgi:hypothetical protein